MTYKQATSVLVVIYTPQLDILLIERTGFTEGWQSVTGSRESDEALRVTAQREVHEETGINAPLSEFVDLGLSTRYPIYERWIHRYAPGVTHNTEHVFALPISKTTPIQLSPEHTRWQWLNWEAAANLVFSPSNAAAIRLIAQYASITQP